MEKANYLLLSRFNKAGEKLKKSHTVWVKTIFCVLFVFGMFVGTAHAQDMKFVEIVASKTYPEGNQITYFTVTEMPTGQNEIDFIKEYTIDKMKIDRLVIFPGKPRCMIDGDAKVDIVEVVSMMNEAAAVWRKQQDCTSKN